MEPLTVRILLLELDIELRLGMLLLDALAHAPGNEQYVAGMLRFAYGSGYQDALTDTPRGKLYRDHDFPIPKRQAKPNTPEK